MTDGQQGSLPPTGLECVVRIAVVNSLVLPCVPVFVVDTDSTGPMRTGRLLVVRRGFSIGFSVLKEGVEYTLCQPKGPGSYALGHVASTRGKANSH